MFDPFIREVALGTILPDVSLMLMYDLAIMLYLMRHRDCLIIQFFDDMT